MDKADLIARLKRINCSIMSDVLDESGFTNQILSHTLRPLDPKIKMAGEALCVQARRIVKTTHGKPLSNYELERRMAPGKVAMIDAGTLSVGAMIGGFAATTLQSKGCTGLVVNGGVRDALEIQQLGLPTYCLAPTPVRGSGRRELVEVDAPIAMPGMDASPVIVHPGDFILGDFDGIAILPLRHAVDLIVAAERVVEIEHAIERDIAAGMVREDALKRHPRFDHIKLLR